MELAKLDRIANCACRIARQARDHEGVLGDARGSCAEIGRELYELGGQDAMLLAFRFVTILWSNGLSCDSASGAFHPRDLALVWDGVGGWQA